MSPPPDAAPPSFTLTLPDEKATQQFAAEIGNALEPGDVVTLSGDLGTGKTTFARALIRHLANDAALAVPSPTFTLVQSYDLPRFQVVHADLYRLSDPDELREIGLEDLSDTAVLLVEWPDKADDRLPGDRIDIALTLASGGEQREARIRGHGRLAPRVARIAALRAFLIDAGYGSALRTRMQGDASTRIYERLTQGGDTAILMNAPRRPDGPPVRDGKPYSVIAHLAEDVTPFVAMADALRGAGFSAPQIHAADLEHGFALLEDFGSELFVSGDPPAPIAERYAAAVDLLAVLHRQTRPRILPVRGGRSYALPPYDLGACLIEAELLLDWYLPHCGTAAQDTTRDAFRSLWIEALTPALSGEQTWVLRDVHSPNLIWLPERNGIARVGLLDFQDALIGPAAYDLASLLQDARVDVPEALERELFQRYVSARKRQADFDATAFAQIYATMAAQRATKILGIFARLNHRDGKPHYLRHIPRVWRYVQRALAHPALGPLAQWYRAAVPPPTGL